MPAAGSAAPPPRPPGPAPPAPAAAASPPWRRSSRRRGSPRGGRPAPPRPPGPCRPWCPGCRAARPARCSTRSAAPSGKGRAGGRRVGVRGGEGKGKGGGRGRFVLPPPKNTGVPLPGCQPRASFRFGVVYFSDSCPPPPHGRPRALRGWGGGAAGAAVSSPAEGVWLRRRLAQRCLRGHRSGFGARPPARCCIPRCRASQHQGIFPASSCTPAR